MKLAALSLCVLLGTPAAMAATAAVAGTVTAVHDGDTWKVDGLTIRGSGFDAPELKQPFGTDAQRALSAAILGKPIRCTIVDHDKYGRPVGLCRVAGVDIGHLMVGAGWAWNSPQYANRYPTEQAAAACGHLGLWRDIGAVLPHDFRGCIK